MPILQGSRYAGVPITGIKFADGKERRFLHSRQNFTLEDVKRGARIHIVRDSDEIDVLAKQFYGDERLWWVIAEVNGLFFPLDKEAELPTGKEIVILPLSDVLAPRARISKLGGG